MKTKRLLAALLLCLGSCVSTAWAQPRVIAHRGHWQTAGAAPNSLESLLAADRIGAPGSECDVCLSGDGMLMVCHGPRLVIGSDTVTVEETPAATLKQYTLENGKPMPSFEQYLAALKKCKQTRLIIELKAYGLTPARETEMAEKTLAMVKKAGLEDRVEYIAFSKHLCQEIARLNPGAKIAYLSGDLSPQEIKAMGLTGLDYHMDVFKARPHWIWNAKKLGLETNVWTVNERDDMRYFIDQGVDYITTDDPETLQQLLQEPSAR